MCMLNTEEGNALHTDQMGPQKLESGWGKKSDQVEGFRGQGRGLPFTVAKAGPQPRLLCILGYLRAYAPFIRVLAVRRLRGC